MLVVRQRPALDGAPASAREGYRFWLRQIMVRDGKGANDRVTILPQLVIPLLEDHLIHVRALHEQDLAHGYGCVYLPDALERKHPNACTE